MERVTNLMESTKHVQLGDGKRSRRISGDTYDQVRTMSARLFSGIRFFFVKFIRNKFNAFFLDPLYVARTNCQHEFLFFSVSLLWVGSRTWDPRLQDISAKSLMLSLKISSKSEPKAWRNAWAYCKNNFSDAKRRSNASDNFTKSWIILSMAPQPSNETFCCSLYKHTLIQKTVY